MDQGDKMNMPNSPTSQLTKDLTKYSILIVDDEKKVLEQLERELKLKGFRVASALSGEEGIEILKKSPAKLVISDQVMPKMNGTEFLTKVKEKYPDVITMILSAYSEKEYIMDALNKAGAYQYLLKPWNTEELIQRITQALQFYHERAERQRLAEANARLLKKISRLEMFSLAGNFSRTLYERFEPYLLELMAASLKSGAGRAGSVTTIIHKLGKLGMLQSTSDHECVSFHNTDVVSLLKNWVTEARALASEVEFVEDYKQDLPPLLLSEEHFSIAIKALIENAIIFNNKKGTKKVFVRAKRTRLGEEDFVQIEIEDNGPGVNEALGEKIYYPLETSHTQDSSNAMVDLNEYNFSRSHHIGLGLSIAQWCITNHDGLLDYRSEKGKGTIFVVRIPVAPEDIKR